MANTIFLEERKLVAKIGSIMLQRNLTDLAGGNISMRVEDRILMSPTYAGPKRFWELEPEMVLVLDLAGNKLEGNGERSREVPTHVRLLNTYYPHGKAVIHAHPRNTLVFCVAEVPIKPVLESTLKFGEIKLAKYANGGSHSELMAENIVEAMKGQEARIAKQAAVVMAPWHGVFAMGKDLPAVLDAIERVENNAYCILMSKLLLADADRLDAQQAALLKAVEDSKGKSSE